jgi:hypothetical protein
MPFGNNRQDRSVRVASRRVSRFLPVLANPHRPVRASKRGQAVVNRLVLVVAERAAAAAVARALGHLADVAELGHGRGRISLLHKQSPEKGVNEKMKLKSRHETN